MQNQEAGITISRNRVKLYPNHKVFLKDGQEFEIELFNPSTSTRLAKISINGKLISQSGMVLKPGQRFYLDRFIDTPDKFKFDTYIVDTGSAAVAEAIIHNGEIQVDFYDEYTAPLWNPPLWNGSVTVSTGGTGWPYNQTFTTSNASAGTYKGFPTGSVTSFCSTDKGLLFNSTDASVTTTPSLTFNLSSAVETGRVEKGSKSDQKFDTYYGTFNTYPSTIIKIQILPFSKKPLEAQDLANYCTSCGTKNKGNKFKFCPQCGTKF